MAKIIEYTSADANITFTRHNDWIELKAPELFNFDKIGATLEGTLCELVNEQIDGKAVLTGRIRHSDGTQTKFRPSFDLKQKIGRQHIGKLILIVFDKEMDTGNAQNKMKVFRVFVAPSESTQPPPFVPTDDDVPVF